VTSTPSTTTSSSVATNTSNPGEGPNNAFPECHEAESGPFAPFCQPTNGSDVWVGETYYVTWDADFFAINSTITIELSYVSTSGGGGNAWSSAKTPNAYGYVTMTMDKAWLQGTSRNNLTLTIVSLGPNVNAQAVRTSGPVISLINKPVAHLPAPPHTKAPNKLGMEIGIPVGVAFIVFVVFGLCIGMRKTRRIGVGNVMGRRKGYGIGKSRRQRVGNNGPIRLDEQEAGPGPWRGHFRDESNGEIELPQRNPGHAREESLGSLVGTPTQEGFGDPTGTRGNAFRDEISRQKTGR